MVCASKIKLLYVITKPELGGAQKQLLSLVRLLNKERFEVFLFTAKEGLLLGDFLAVPGLKIKISRFLERPINPFQDLLALIEIYRFIKQNKIDIVHTHSSKAGILGRLAARLARRRVIIHTVHGWPFNDFQPRLSIKLYVLLERICARLCDRIIVVANHDLRRGLESGIGEENKYCLIRYGIDYSEFDTGKSSIRKELGIKTDDRVVGMVSCFKPQKSPLDFVRLAYLVNKELPNTKFILVGDGILRSRIKRLISQFHLEKQVILTGWRRDIPQVLTALDVCVLTSLWEGLPISVLEAMSASLPVVATDTGGVKEAVQEGESGFIVPLGDVKKMSERVIALLKGPELRKQFGEKGRLSLGNNFSLKNMVEQTNELYVGLIKTKEGSYVN